MEYNKDMKSLWTITALAGFISISVFGLLLMPYDGSDHDTACLASVINNAQSPCPEDDPLGFINFHNNAIQKISGLIPVDAASVAYFAFIIGMIFYFTLASYSQSSLAARPVFITGVEYTVKSLSSESGNIYWLSLHENSPSFA
jgi:hypothetical protein